jgi:hypothetical protein
MTPPRLDAGAVPSPRDEPSRRQLTPNNPGSDRGGLSIAYA